MTNEDMREAIRKFVILRCHPECNDYEEAIKEELSQGVWIVDKEGIHWFVGFPAPGGKSGVQMFAEEGLDYRIQGFPITLSRLLCACGHVSATSYGEGANVAVLSEGNGEGDDIIPWVLVGENGKECTLDDQHDRTIEKLYDLLEKS